MQKRYVLVQGVPGRCVPRIVPDGEAPRLIGLRRLPDNLGKNLPDCFEVVEEVVEVSGTDLGRTNAKRLRKGDLVHVRGPVDARNITEARKLLGCEED